MLQMISASKTHTSLTAIEFIAVGNDSKQTLQRVAAILKVRLLIKSYRCLQDTEGRSSTGASFDPNIITTLYNNN
jgi:hypothetical protein